jgi:pyruvate formate lyase activating enzyme
MGTCQFCGQKAITISDAIGYCYRCLRQHFSKLETKILSTHAKSRNHFGLPASIPKNPKGTPCHLCANHCQLKEREIGYCGIRKNVGGKIVGGIVKGNLHFYYDSLPTNCVADWVCPGDTGSGYPKYAYKDGPEVEYSNLAVFYQACNFNCLYCQNFSFKEGLKHPNLVRIDELVEATFIKNVSCICFFGGDPTPQIIHALAVSKKILKRKNKPILRICFETNGAVNHKILKKMAEISLKSGGCIKFDLKAWHKEIHKTLCSVPNKETLKNFSWIASLIKERPKPAFLIASTLLVPGYVDEEEVKEISNFIAKLDPNIPYTLLAFYPTFILNDLPKTSYSHAHRCLKVAKEAGLKQVRVGNQHLLGNDYV